MSHRLRRLTAFSAVALLAVVYLCWICGASARHLGTIGADAPGDFAYYVLSLSWSPAFCLSSPGATECNGPHRYGCIVHGLWPQYDQGWPEHCDVHRAVPEEVVQGMADLMPARDLVIYGWSAHGTCSGLEPAEFFALVRKAKTSVAIPQELLSPTQATQQSPSAITSAFLHARDLTPADSLAVKSIPAIRLTAIGLLA